MRAEGVSKVVPTAVGRLAILEGIDLSIKRGDSMAIIGASGSGKTTLLGLLAGLDVPSSGRIVLDGREISAMNEEARARVRAECVGFVFQTFQLLDSLTAIENVMLPAELRGDRDAGAQAEVFLERVGLSARATHYPRQLSGGEQQRVAIARAFASRPSVLFADEPTGNLDTRTGQRIADLLFDLNRDGSTTLVLVTHDSRLADRCGRAVVLDGGLVSERREGPVSSRAADPVMPIPQAEALAAAPVDGDQAG